MNVRPDIAELLHAGVPQSRIARQLGCAPITVQRTREALGMPSPGQGRRPVPENWVEALNAHSKPTEDGHVTWAGWSNSYGTPMVTVHKTQRSAYRVAFTAHHGREPEGRVTPGCGRQGCVRGDHLDDEPMRQKAHSMYAAIFGSAE